MDEHSERFNERSCCSQQTTEFLLEARSIFSWQITTKRLTKKLLLKVDDQKKIKSQTAHQTNKQTISTSTHAFQKLIFETNPKFVRTIFPPSLLQKPVF